MSEVIPSVYFDVQNPASFSSYSNLRRVLNRSVKTKDIKQFLQGQEAYTVHRSVRRKFKRDRVFVTNISDLWEMDLMDMPSHKDWNQGVGFVLVAIDVFSKYAWVRPLKDKSAQNVRAALESIFSTLQHTPLKIHVDKGKEFLNRQVQDLMKKNNIHMYVTENADIKCSVAERFIRTFKTRLVRYLTYKNTFKYVDVLQDLVNGYNNTFHRSIGMKPVEVTEQNVLQVWRRLYGSKIVEGKAKPTLRENDNVRVSRQKDVFQKGHKHNFSEEIFKVKTVLKRNPVLYEICDLNGEQIKGRFYEKELQRVTLPSVYKIERIVRRRGKGVKREYFVKWLNYSEQFNSWVNASQVEALKS
jgi:hypothetical protein